MKLSEAIMAGSVLARPHPGQLHTHSGEGACALGMAELAIGKRSKPYATLFDAAYVESWPWCAVQCCPYLKCPIGNCDPQDDLLMGTVHVTDQVAGMIAHIFDKHVCEYRDWTLDQLCDWVKTVEPVEAADAARVLGERDHADRREIPDSQDGRAELLRVGEGA